MNGQKEIVTCGVSRHKIGSRYCTRRIGFACNIEGKFYRTIVAKVIAAAVPDILHLRLVGQEHWFEVIPFRLLPRSEVVSTPVCGR